MPINGEHDPFRPVDDLESERKRCSTVWGSKLFKETYASETFAERFEKQTLDRNPWSIARAEAEAREEAKQKALDAAATADLVHQAIQMRVEADAVLAAKRLGKAEEASAQEAKDRETLASVGVTDEALVGSAPAATDSTKPRGGKGGAK
jgi:hypothetical protein